MEPADAARVHARRFACNRSHGRANGRLRGPATLGKHSLGNAATAPQVPDVRASRCHQAQRPLDDDYR